ncbi:MAG: phospholipase D-like domain-containing protein [Bdellovibrionota bacterium]
MLESAPIVSQLNQIFATDTDVSKGDIIDLLKVNSDGSSNGPDTPFSGIESDRLAPALSSETGDVSSATLIAAPNSLPGLVSFIRSDEKSVALEFMSLPATWKSGGESQSALVKELVAAASRGADVRVLLNDESVFGNPPGFLPENLLGNADAKKGNEITVEYLNQLALCKHLSIEAKIVDIKAVEITYIHNKGLIVDGKRVLVSSINGTRNSVMDNREIAVALESSDAADYYGRAFSFDWSKSASKIKTENCLSQNPITEIMGWQTMPFLQ